LAEADAEGEGEAEREADTAADTEAEAEGEEEGEGEADTAYAHSPPYGSTTTPAPTTISTPVTRSERSHEVTGPA
jgi:type II secretory pathway component PulK